MTYRQQMLADDRLEVKGYIGTGINEFWVKDFLHKSIHLVKVKRRYRHTG